MIQRSPKRTSLALLCAAGLALGAATALTAPAAAETVRTSYIVMLDAQPVATYTGGTDGLAATAPAAGQKIDRASTRVQAYRQYLDRLRERVLGVAPGAEVFYEYDYTVAGFAARLTAAEAAALSRRADVAAVVPDDVRRLDTSRTPTFLGLTGSNGTWAKLGGPTRAGDRVIVGIIDSGFIPENASFGQMVTTPASDAAVAAKFSGSCDPGDEAPFVTCNKKVIGAQYFDQGIGSRAIPEEFDSARDYAGHGSHTASTAAGNDGVAAVVNGQNVGTISGMAPQARLSIYKVCYTIDYVGGNSCYSTDSVAAIDMAVADGVDVLNYSISGSTNSFVDTVEVAFYRAAAAGVFVAASAGNSGPGASTVAHNSPWLTTVAASTLDRAFEASTTLGNGTTYDGVGLGQALPNRPLVYAGDVKTPSAPLTEAQLCYPGSLDPAKVANKIVLCDRGTIARVAKSKTVADAGGAGMILANTSPNTLNADLHFVPTVHVTHTDRTAIMNYIDAAATPTAALAAGTEVLGVRAPLMATFSSRGPAVAGGGDLIKPDITAPGVDVLAAYAPTDGGYGYNFNFLSGTSMSGPHIAGLAALMIQAHPTWSPMMIKSSLMTSASVRDNTDAPIVNDDGTPAGPFNYGSGHVTPNSALNPGLVFDSTATDWQKFVCGTGARIPGTPQCSVTGSIDPSNLNYASIGIGRLQGSQAVTRTVTNVNNVRTRYTVAVSAPAGTTVTVNPPVVTLAAGQSATLTITITRTTAPLNAYTFGSLTWTPQTQSGVLPSAVRIPIAVKPVA